MTELKVNKLEKQAGMVLEIVKPPPFSNVSGSGTRGE